MPLIAAIDIGTNSTKMTIAEIGIGGKPLPIRTEAKTTRLGRNVDKSGRLEAAGMGATLAELVRFKAITDDLGVSAVAAVGTSALRDASNGAAYLRQIHEQTGFSVEIVTGDREAELAYLAVYSDGSLCLDSQRPLTVFDLGGGSTELTLGIGPQIIAHSSVNIGAVRITERFLSDDPPTAAQINDARSYAVATIATAGLPPEAAHAQLVGLGGSVVNLASIKSAGTVDPHGAELMDAEVSSILSQLAARTLNDRKRITGLEPERADVIIGGAIVAQAVLGYVGAVSFRVSTRGLRFGLLSELAGQLARP